VNAGNGSSEGAFVPAKRDTGMCGEDIACRHLQSEGYRILSRNYRGGRCELDIIAEIGETIVFCEVKTDRTGRFGSPITWVTPGKIRHIARAARDYILSHKIEGRMFRFDVIGLEAREGGFAVTHIENAFYAPPDV
jgi:putative endonuclease